MTHSRGLGLAIGLLIALAVGVGLVRVNADEPKNDRGEDPGFHVAGDGALPDSPPDLGPARAPLSAEETGYAIHLVTEAVPQARDVGGRSGPQVLSVDLPRPMEARGATRLATVTSYDYATDRLSQHLVSLSGRTVTSTISEAKTQPPIVPDEADAAMELALASDIPLAFTSQFEEEQGVPLLSAEQISYVAGAWVYEPSAGAGKRCGVHRCARLLIQSPGGSYLQTDDFIVDLSARTIVKVQ